MECQAMEIDVMKANLSERLVLSFIMKLNLDKK